MTCETALAKEAGFRQDGDHRFFAPLGYHRKLYLAALDIENGIRTVALRKDGCILFVLRGLFSNTEFSQEKARIEQCFRFRGAPISVLVSPGRKDAR